MFGDVADKIVISNTKGFTGHAMGTGIEDVVAVKALETGCVPPVANFKEVDPELGTSEFVEGRYLSGRIRAALGSRFWLANQHDAVALDRAKDGVRTSPHALGYASRIADTTVWSAWLSRVAGQPAADLEVVQRTLRVRDRVAEARIVEVAREVQAAPAQATIKTAPPSQSSKRKRRPKQNPSPRP